MSWKRGGYRPGRKTSAAVPIVAFVAVLASIILYRQLQIGAFRSIQLASTLAQLARRGRVVIDGLYAVRAPGADPVEDPDRAGLPVATQHARPEIRWPRPAAISKSSTYRASCARRSGPKS